MKKKFYIPFFVFGLYSINALGQSENKKADTVTPARQVIVNKTGEKNLPQQLRQEQLTEQPAILNKDSVVNCSSASKHKKSARPKQKKDKSQ